MRAVDTSVLVAAFASWHERHQLAFRALRDARLIGHVVVETYSVLTRLPPPHRVAPETVVDFLRALTDQPPLTPSPRLLTELPPRLARAGLTGGASYDALIGATAAEAGAELVSLDVRAVQTYRALEVRYRLLSA